MADVPPVVIQFKGDIKDIKQSLKVVQDELKGFQKHTESAGKSTKDLSAKTVAAGALMAEALKKVGSEVLKLGKEFVSTYTDIGKEVRKLTRVLGGSAEDMSRLRYAAEAVGLSTETVVRGMKILSTHLTANDKAAKALGISYRDANGHLLPATTILENLSEKFSKLPPGLERTALATKAFGRGGLEMLPILGMGKEKLTELYKECDKLGLTLTGQNLQAVKEFTMKQRELHAAFGGLQLAIGKEIVPALTNMMNSIVENVIPHLQDFVNGLTGKNGLTGALDGSSNSANHWGKIVRAIIGTILNLKKELAGLAALFLTVWAVAKTIAAINAITTAIGLLRLAYVAAGDAALVSAAKEKLVAAGGIVSAIGTLILKIGALTVAHQVETVTAGETAIAEGALAAATGAASAAMVVEAGTAVTTAVAMDALAVSAGAAAVAETAASLGTAAIPIAIGVAAVVATLAGAGLYVKHKYDKAANAPVVLRPGDPGFIGPVYDPTKDPNSPQYIAPPEVPKVPKTPKTPPPPTLKDTLIVDAQKQKASVWLKKHGASQGLIDAILSSADWRKDYGKVSGKGSASVKQYQALFNRTAAGVKEVADAAKAKAEAVAKKAQTALEGVAGRVGVVDAQFNVAMSTDANRSYQTRITDAKRYVGYAARVVKEAREQEKKTRGTTLHAEAVKVLTSALSEQAKIQKEVNKLTKEAAEALAEQAKQQAFLTSTQTANNTYLANQMKRSGPGAKDANSFITVPVIIDGQTVFRVTQKVSLQNNRRNVSNGLAVSGSVI